MIINAEEYHAEIERLQNVILNPALLQKMKPLFPVYFRSTVTCKEGVRNYFLENLVISNYLETRGKDILEVGCGFGLRLICLALLGSQRAVGIDISEEMIQGFQTLLREFPDLPIKAEMGDFLLTSYPPSSFDRVILVESISHIRDTDLLLYKIKQVLRPRGVLYISDGNNDLCLTARIGSRKDWRRSEYGPIAESEAQHGREVDRLCFFDARVKIIRSIHPSLDDTTVAIIAKKS